MYDKIDIFTYEQDVVAAVLDLMRSKHLEQVGDCYGRKFLLKNGRRYGNEHSLILEIVEKVHNGKTMPPQLHISGSLRKWFYGALSMRDLTQHDTLLALQKLAEGLRMLYDQIKEWSLSSVEVGLNVDLGDLRCAEVQNRLCSFKDARYQPYDTEGYRRFKASKFSGATHDKVPEVKREIRKHKAKGHGVERFFTEYANKNILRVEFKAHGGAAKISEKFGIRTLGDMVDRYNDVVWRFADYVEAMGFRSLELPLFSAKKCKEFTDYLSYCGLLVFGDVELASMLRLMPPQARKDVRKAVKRLRQRMPDPANVGNMFIEAVVQAMHKLLDLRDSQPRVESA